MILRTHDSVLPNGTTERIVVTIVGGTDPNEVARLCADLSISSAQCHHNLRLGQYEWRIVGSRNDESVVDLAVVTHAYNNRGRKRPCCGGGR